MTRILVDTNVVLDVLLNRAAYVQSSLRVWAMCDSRVQGLLAAHAVTTVHYLIRGGRTHAETMDALERVLRVFGVAAVDELVIQAAFRTRARDFEDEVTAAAAVASKCSLIVTRDPRGFQNSRIPALSPEKFLQSMSV